MAGLSTPIACKAEGVTLPPKSHMNYVINTFNGLPLFAWMRPKA